MKNRILEFLFSTEAIKVAPKNEMFLFTSGLISPYYVSTHFLCGGEEASTNMLSYIDSFKNSPGKIVSEVAPKILELATSDQIYSDVISLMKLEVTNYCRTNAVDYISGGERRDWFFSIPLAKELGIPHIYLYNNQLVLDDKGEELKFKELKNSVHVADLLTVGSSYTSKWIPALAARNIQIGLSINCVDRAQGGSENLLTHGVKQVSELCRIDKDFFKSALSFGVINKDQESQLEAYFDHQYESMKEFLLGNPEFIFKSLKADQKTRSRMLLNLKNDLYNLGDDFVSQFLN